MLYVIRETVEAPAEADDLMFTLTDSKYISIRDEVEARAEHAESTYKSDNVKVFELLRDAIADHDEVKVWIKSFIRSKDSCGAWTAFKSHYLGMAQLDTIANCADSRIENLVYNGEKSRYSFETHVSNFKKAHLDLKRAGNEADDRSKV